MLFLATANVIDNIPGPLLDRMELVALDGYTEDEKVAIARDHLLPRQLERAGLDDADVTIEDEALRRIAGDYTREAGVRQLERALARILRKVAVELVEDHPTRSAYPMPTWSSTWAGRGSSSSRQSVRRCPVWPPVSP